MKNRIYMFLVGFFKKSCVRVFFKFEYDALHKRDNSVIIYLLSVFSFFSCIVLFSVGSVNMPYLCLCVFIV